MLCNCEKDVQCHVIVFWLVTIFIFSYRSGHLHGVGVQRPASHFLKCYNFTDYFLQNYISYMLNEISYIKNRTHE